MPLHDFDNHNHRNWQRIIEGSTYIAGLQDIRHVREVMAGLAAEQAAMMAGGGGDASNSMQASRVEDLKERLMLMSSLLIELQERRYALLPAEDLVDGAEVGGGRVHGARIPAH